MFKLTIITKLKKNIMTKNNYITLTQNTHQVKLKPHNLMTEPH